MAKATHKNGNRLDVTLGTQYIFDNTIATDSLHEDDITELDHTALFIDMNTTIFMNNDDPIQPLPRGFTSKNKNKFKKFGQRVDDQLCQNMTLDILLHKLEEANESNIKQIYKQINIIITTTMIKEENRLASAQKIIAWSPKYAEARSRYLDTRSHHRKF